VSDITLGLTGDLMLGRRMNEAIAREGFAYPWGDMLPRLREVDLLLVNLECALTQSAVRWHDGNYKAFYFRAEPSVVETLRLANVRFASLANNHALDFGPAGLLDTIHTLNGTGIAHAGAGATLAEARAPALIEAGGLQVQVVAFTDHPFAWRAEADAPGVNYTPVSIQPGDLDPVREAIGAARQTGGLVIFCIHWGPNMRLRPPPAFRAFARAVIDAGADVFWGHSAHVVQGIEVYRGRPILYDTGDFVDDYAVNPALRNDLSALFHLAIGPRGIQRLDLVPVRLGRMQVNAARGRERDWFIRRTADLSAELGTQVHVSGNGASVAIADEPAHPHYPR
jgi:poly-gamma-glutamate capsule biosynthesis protein CapA/YwtB (metallophosphatase superfamily)